MYYLLFFIGITLSIVKDKNRVALVMFTLLLALVAFFRYGVGADYFNYEYLFDRLDKSLMNEYRNGVDPQEIGFRLIGTLLKSIGFSYQQYLIFFAIVNLYFVSKTCKRYSENPVLSMLVYLSFYYFVWTFSGLRQGIVLAVGIYYLLRTIENNKKVKFFVIVVVLTLIHSSAILLLFLYAISMFNLSKQKLYLLTIVSIMFSVLPIGNLLLKMSFIPFLDKLIPYVNLNITLTNIVDFQSIGRLLFLALIFIYYDVYSKKDEISKKILNIYILSLCLYFVFKSSELVAARLSIYGKYLDIIILVNIYYLYKQKINKILYSFALVLLCTIYFTKELNTLKNQTGLVTNNKVFVPYTNINNGLDYFSHNRYGN